MHNNPPASSFADYTMCSSILVLILINYFGCWGIKSCSSAQKIVSFELAHINRLAIQKLERPLCIPNRPNRWMLNRPKEMNVLKYCCHFFPAVCTFAPFFHLVMPRHVYAPCYAQFQHARNIEGYVTYNLVCYVRLRVQNMPGWVSLEKKMHGENGQTEGKFCSNIFVLTAFISFGLFNIFRQNMPQAWFACTIRWRDKPLAFMD